VKREKEIEHPHKFNIKSSQRSVNEKQEEKKKVKKKAQMKKSSKLNLLFLVRTIRFYVRVWGGSGGGVSS
jgi:hypothetical protein